MSNSELPVQFRNRSVTFPVSPPGKAGLSDEDVKRLLHLGIILAVVFIIFTFLTDGMWVFMVVVPMAVIVTQVYRLRARALETAISDWQALTMNEAWAAAAQQPPLKFPATFVPVADGSVVVHFPFGGGLTAAKFPYGTYEWLKLQPGSAPMLIIGWVPGDVPGRPTGRGATDPLLLRDWLRKQRAPIASIRPGGKVKLCCEDPLNPPGPLRT